MCWRNLCVILFLCLLSSGCNFLGPKVIPQVRQGYNSALKNTDEEQLLLNMVRMRYGDRPYFLSVASITESTSFARGGSVSANGAATNQRFLESYTNNPFRILFGSLETTANANYTEIPTITYLPLQGSTFTKQMLMPVSLEKIVLLVRSGWSVARVLRITAQSIGNLKNAPGSTRPATSHIPEYKAFVDFSHYLRKLDLKSVIGIHVLPRKKNKHIVVEVALLKHAPTNRRQMRNLLVQLGFKSWHEKFYIVESDRGTVDDATATVTIQTRSYLGILYFLSKSVEVLPQDIAQNIVVAPRYSNGEYFNWQNVTNGMMKIYHCLKKPQDVTASVFYRGMWFYIRDTDSDSKETLSLLEQLFSLQAGDVTGNPPSLTLPI